MSCKILRGSLFVLLLSSLSACKTAGSQDSTVESKSTDNQFSQLLLDAQTAEKKFRNHKNSCTFSYRLIGNEIEVSVKDGINPERGGTDSLTSTFKRGEQLVLGLATSDAEGNRIGSWCYNVKRGNGREGICFKDSETYYEVMMTKSGPSSADLRVARCRNN